VITDKTRKRVLAKVAELRRDRNWPRGDNGEIIGNLAYERVSRDWCNEVADLLEELIK